jgi:hypothetical protein
MIGWLCFDRLWAFLRSCPLPGSILRSGKITQPAQLGIYDRVDGGYCFVTMASCDAGRLGEAHFGLKSD